MSGTDSEQTSPFRRVEEVNHSPEREERILAFWREEGAFRASVQLREGAPDYVFFEGPPTANGLPGVHHVQSRTFKDLICRLKTMEGYRVLRKAGWDTHGLPVEIEVEKELGLTHKAEIEEYGVEAFNEKCRESVRRYEEDWRRLTERIAFWLDLDDPYFTFTNDYIESVWWIIARFFEQDLIYRGHRISPYCPRCGTPLSTHEVSLGYREADDPSIHVRFPVREDDHSAAVLGPLPEGMRRSLLVWTTTPWTMISNTFTVAHAELDYVELELDTLPPIIHDALDTLYGDGYAARTRAGAAAGQGRERLILAESRARHLFGDQNAPGSYGAGIDVVGRIKGSDLAGVRYQRPFTFMEMDESVTNVVLTDDYVTDEEGTGLVHSSPAYGEDDYNTGMREGMPIVEPVDREGTFIPEVEPWAGVFVKEADAGIVADLAARGLLLMAGVDSHTYPFCWRCDSPLLYMAQPSWYVRTTAIKEKLLSANREIDWIPPEIGTGRMGEWLENNQDWALSRDRYWGTPLPIWVCSNSDCAYQICISSVEELRTRAGTAGDAELDLHKPHVDELTWPCPECGAEMRRTPEVIDCWFDSGAMPFAQWHYPFENREMFERQYPADFISEGVDQTRGWFYSLLAISAFLTDRPSYRHCLVQEMVLDREGRKMSKSKGNTVDPWDVISAWGADPLRWYLVTNSPPWIPTRFDAESVAEVSRKFFGTLHNTHAFFALYAAVDGWHPGSTRRIPAPELPALDRWLLSRLNGTAREVRRHLAEFELTRAARALQHFVIEDLSNWYVRRSRRRFWKGEPGPDKDAAYATLHTTLVTMAGLLAPFVPFTSEELWLNLEAWRENAAPSVHLSDYPAGDDSLVDDELERRMAYVREIVTLGRAARNRAGLKVRQPLDRFVVTAPRDWQRRALDELGDLIREEMNVKRVEGVDSASAFMVLSAQPHFSALGPRYGSQVNDVADAIRGLEPGALAGLAEGRNATVTTSAGEIQIEPGDVLLEEAEPEELTVEQEGELAVAIDTRLTDALLAEGLAREFTTRVQALRREVGYAVTDRVRIGYEASPGLTDALDTHAEYVSGEALATELRAALLDSSDRRVEWQLDSEHVTITIAKA